MVNMDQAWLLPAFPAGAFVILALFHQYLPRKGDWLAIAAIIAAFIGMISVAADLFDQLPVAAAELVNNTSGFDWVKIEDIDFILRIGFHVDQLTMVMLAVVTFVGMLVQIYSLGYMKGEPRYGWYYAVISLFIASMLTLVLADNFLLLYVTWEGVGICSYLLIGHYFERRSAAEAAKKAFITTRFGDVFLLIGIVMLWREANTFDMSEIFHMAEEGGFDRTYLTAATLFLFGGAAGKSAQFPFHVWLPDAMEGPTPVSALIHAATMVVAGVYLVARTMPLFEASYDGALYFVVAIGMITTFMSAFMGLVMTDIKKVVAYSTLNSLGLMMVALGFGESGVGPAMLYLFCHAFFKALLFLGCGSVIHATGTQEMGELGGVSKKLPLTNVLFFIGAMSMAGMVPLSGFFAKDEILVWAEDFSLPVLILLLITLPITAMYMLRLYMLTFTGEPKAAAHGHDDHGHDEHAHESLIMTGPLVLLGGLALVAGFVVFGGVGEALGLGSGFLEFVEYTLSDHPHEFEFDWPMAIISTVLVLAGLGIAKYAWSGEMAPAKAAGARFPFLYKLFSSKFYMDDFYQWCINNLILGLARFVAFFDRTVVNDTGINGPGEVTGGLAWVAKYQQTGKLPHYALAMILGVVVLTIAAFSVKG
ncbi:MAG TPA: NADH-quinone oxidoreductase subunit L [Dehalococcoidia bacterium]|nr:NADH-quinone oxidoreductase subunit L [Dehalococcoidia bacterium]